MAKPQYTEWLKEDGLLRIKGWAREGFSNEQIASNMGIHAATLYAWMKDHNEISDALKEGRRPVLTEIEDAFYSKCRWSEYEETREEITKGKDGKESKRIIRIRHRVPPDTGALIFALKNLAPQRWRDKPVVVDSNSSAAFDELVNRIGDAINGN